MKTIQLLTDIMRVAEFAACITAFACWRQLKGSYWITFPFYLLFIVIVEYFGNYFNQRGLYHHTRDMFNYIQIPLDFLYLTWLVSRITGLKFRLWCIQGLIFLFVWFAEQFILPPHQYYFLSLSISTGGLLLLVLLIYYFIQLSGSDAIIYFYRQLSFWVLLGLLIYYVGSIPFYGMFNYLVRNARPVHFMYTKIVYILSIGMYILFIIGLLWPKRNSESF